MKKSNNKAAAILLLQIVALSACVSTADVQRANDRIEALWRSENAVILKEDGTQVVDLSMEEALRVTEKSLYEIGFDSIEVERDRGLIRGERRLTDADISDEARRREEPRMKEIAVEEVGLMGQSVGLNATGSTLLAEVRLRDGTDGVVVSVDRAWIEHSEAPRQEGIRLNNQVAPTSLKAGIYEFTQAFERNAKAIKSEQAEATVPRKSPSEWILPPSE